MSQIVLAKFFTIGAISRVIRSSLSKIIILAIFIILPCSVEALQFRGGQEWFKHDFGFFMGNKAFGGDYSVDKFIPCYDVLSQKKYFIDKNSPESSSSFVKFSDSDCLYASENGQLMLEDGSKKIDDNSTECSSREKNNIVYKIVHSGYFPILTFCIGCIMTGFYCFFIVHRYTQRPKSAAQAVPRPLE